MRTLLLGLLPLACTVSSAAPSAPPRDRAPVPDKIAIDPAAPIIEKGSGCYANQDIATGGAGMRDRRGGPHGRPARAPAESAPTGAAPPPPPSPAPKVAVGGGRPAPQAPNGVRAGEWDDNANYRDYVKWLASSPIKGKLAIGNRQFVVVTDRAGKAVPNCPITVAAGGHTANLVTMASGRALVFPAALGLTGTATVTASCQGATATARLDTRAVDGVAKLVIEHPRALPARRPIDLAFVLDTTGSMSEEIDAVKQTIQAVATQLSGTQADVRIGLVEYKDRSDCLLTRTFPFSADLRGFAASVAGVTASGGGDYPEDLHKGLEAALDKLAWRGDAAARMIVVIGDAPPQFYGQSRDYANAAMRAAARGIKIYTVAASGMDPLGQVVMRQLAQYTGASNMFVLRGGAGPQSVGGGDPASACGGTHDEYASGKLDLLILRKLRGELAQIDADPMKIPGRGKDENAKPCNQRLVVAN